LSPYRLGLVSNKATEHGALTSAITRLFTYTRPQRNSHLFHPLPEQDLTDKWKHSAKLITVTEFFLLKEGNIKADVLLTILLVFIDDLDYDIL
jgi:hypothetical protein